MTAGDPFQSEVAKAALGVAAPYGFALGGGQALVSHGIVSRPTEDIDLFTDSDDGIGPASELVETELSKVGFEVEFLPGDTDLSEIFDGFENQLVEFEVRRGKHTVRLTLARFDRGLEPVLLDIGPVLHIEDVIGSKVAAMATRAEPRDFVDVAAALRLYTREQLLELAHRSDPALIMDEVAESMRLLDRVPDAVFTRWVAAEDVATLREAFTGWPR